MKTIIIGSGNVAGHLLKAFSQTENIEVIQIYSRNEERGEYLANKYQTVFTPFLDEIKDADLYIMAISDSSIVDLSYDLPLKGKLIAHTSGTTELESLSDNNRRAVFYPLQTFTKGKSMNFRNIPLCLEAENNDDLEVLKSAANSISNTVVEMNSETRKRLHLIAVFVNNFTNHMFTIAKELSDEFNIDFNIFKPLIEETVDKIKAIDPIDAQTGPASRGDLQTMEKHFALLNDEVQKNLYKLVSNSIMNSAGKR